MIAWFSGGSIANFLANRLTQSQHSLHVERFGANGSVYAQLREYLVDLRFFQSSLESA
jgi:hypothetical protein